MKRFLALFLAFCMLVPFTAFAETKEVSTASVSDTSYNIYIEGESEASSVSVVLRNQDATDIAYVTQLTPDKTDNGKYFTKFKFNGDIANYGIYVRDDLTGADVSESVRTAVAKDELYTASLDVAVSADNRTFIAEGDAINVSVDIKNKYGDDETMKVLVAAYDENKSLLAVKDTTLTALFTDLDITKDATTNFEVPANTKKVKVFIWSGTETMIPVAPSKALVSEEDAITIHLVGDSLCQKYVDSVYPRQGWGAFIQNYVAEGVKVNNTGVASRSTFSYLYGEPGHYNSSGNFVLDTGVKGTPYYDYESSRWKMTFINKAKAGDYVIIGLGINDLYQSGSDIYEHNGKKYLRKSVNREYVYNEITYNEDGSVASVSEENVSLSNPVRIYSWIALSQSATKPEGSYMTYFKDNLRTMIDTALEIGVTPILTSTTGHYSETNYEDTWSENPAGLTKLFGEMKEVAEEYKDKGVVYLPLFEYTDKIFHEWGNKVRFDTVHLRPGAYDWFRKYGNKEVTYADTKVDGVHYNENGAKWVASQIMRLAYESGSTIKNYINEPDVFDIPMIVLDK